MDGARVTGQYFEYNPETNEDIRFPVHGSTAILLLHLDIGSFGSLVNE